MSSPVWTLTTVGGGSAGANLAGCHITKNTAGTAYVFTKPDISDVLSTSSGSSLPTGSFTFPVFSYNGLSWTIAVSALTPGSNASGTWNTPGDGSRLTLDNESNLSLDNEYPDTGTQNGDYTAQAGSGFAPDTTTYYAKA
jgi:hypothetical protein